MQNPKVSLIMSTLGRYNEIILLLNSLLEQSYKNFELIIIDQNDDDLVTEIYNKYREKLNITYIKSEKKGLSVGRNIGLNYISGDIVAFPDDDCEYNSDTLEKAALFFNENPDYNFLTCNTREKYGNNSIFEAKKENCNIGISNIMYTGISFTIFIRLDSIATFNFDEKLGVGAEFGSGEETDLLLYLLKNNNRGFYYSNSYIFHPYKPETVEKAFQYGKGYGAIHKKAFFVYKFYRLFFMFLITLLKEAVKICFYPHSSVRLSSMQGRIYGFIHY